MAACNIIRDDKGKVIFTEAPNGKESKLFNDLTKNINDKEEALKVWLVSKTKDFNKAITFPKGFKYRNTIIGRLRPIKVKSGTMSIISGKEEIKYDLINLDSEVVRTKSLSTLNISANPLEGEGKTQKLGRIRFKETEFEVRVDSSLLTTLERYDSGKIKDLKGLGLGTLMYSKLIEYALGKGKKVVSSTKLTDGSRGVWENLAKLGVAKPIEGGGFEVSNMPSDFDSNGEPSVGQLLNYVDGKSIDKTIDKEFQIELENMMLGMNVKDASDLQGRLRKGYFPQGSFKPTRNSLVSSGIYSNEEITDILTNESLQEEVKKFIYKLEAVPNEVPNTTYVDSAYLVVQDGNKNEIGKFNLDNPYSVERRAIEELGGIDTREEFEQALFDSEMTDIVTPAYLDRMHTKQDLYYKFKAFKRVPVVTIEEGQLTLKPNNTREYLKETLTEAETTNLTDNLDFLISLDNKIWEEAVDSVYKIMNDIEQDMIGIGLDATQLVSRSRGKSVEEIKDFFKSTKDFVQGASESSFDNLVGEYNDFFNVNTSNVNKKSILFERGLTDNVFYMDTPNVPNIELFSKYGLIPLGDGVYKRVIMDKPVEVLYEAVYTDTIARGYTNIFPDEAVMPTGLGENGKLDLNKILDPINKESIKEDINNYVNSKINEIYREGVEVTKDNLERYAIFYNFYNRTSDFSKLEYTPKMSSEYKIFIEGINNTEYLKTEFISDFNKKILKEKSKQSKAYKEFYSNFRISSNGITAISNDPIARNLAEKYLEENEDLVQYMKLHKQGVSYDKEIIKDPIRDDLFLRNYYSNYPEALRPYKGDYREVDNSTLTASSKSPFIRISKGIYEFVKAAGKVGIYGRLATNMSMYKEYDMGMSPPTLSENVSKLKSIETSSGANIEINNLYSEKESKEIDKNHDNC